MSILSTSSTPFWPWLILVTAYGACIGSFLNVVIWRLPRGESLWHPGSHCPKCNHALAWHDNIPVIGWLRLRGRCRYCRAPISAQYPIIEALTALLLGGLFAVLYGSNLRPEFAVAGFMATWPAFLVYAVLAAAILAATIIDARLYIIPLPIPWFATVTALVIYPAAVTWWPDVSGIGPGARGDWWGRIVGAAAGLIVANLLLKYRLIPRSFDEEPGQGGESVGGGPEEWMAHPHPRREVLKEVLFLLPVAVGITLGSLWRGGGQSQPLWLNQLMGVVLGYLVGGGLIWLTRIGGTLAFGREAMGLGDVHLLAAIGAVLGPVPAVLVFFIAPFLGLVYAVVAIGISKLRKGEVHVIPYGPYLAAAAVIVMLLEHRILAFLGM